MIRRAVGSGAVAGQIRPAEAARPDPEINRPKDSQDESEAMIEVHKLVTHYGERQILYERVEDLAYAAPTLEDITGTAQARPIALALTPLQEFVRTSVSGIGLLMAGTLLALLLANIPLSEGYTRFWETHLTVGVPGFSIDEPLRRWVNDALMAVFFFLLGLEIKREVLVGESARPAAGDRAEP